MSFFQTAIFKQQTSRTVEEAKENLEFTCNRCIKAMCCEESRCPTMQAHNARINYLEATKLYKKECSAVFVKTRNYDSSKTNLAKKRMLSYLTKLYNKIDREKNSLLCLIDDVSVQVELEDYNNAICILRKHKLPEIAKHLEILKNKGEKI